MLVWLLVLVPLALGTLAQRRVRQTFRRYRAVPDRSGLAGAEVARLLLDAHGLVTIRVEAAPGMLTDHYDAEAGTLRLSAAVGAGRSVAAVGVAAHEVAHAYQDAEGSRAYRLRKRVGEPLARLAPYTWLMIFGGFYLGSPPLVAFACLYMAGLVAFSAITLPVELGASRRALLLLQRTGLARAGELDEIRDVLRAAGLTYVAGIAQQLGLFLAMLLIAATVFGLHVP
jgi:Zn-dependent membrane protease YugP